MTFICPDPKKYGPAKDFEFNSGIQTIINPGYAAVDPTIECVFEEKATSYEVALLNDDGSVSKTIKPLYDFIAGDTLVIDSAKRKVTCGSNLIMTALQIQSDYFCRRPGRQLKSSSVIRAVSNLMRHICKEVRSWLTFIYFHQMINY